MFLRDLLDSDVKTDFAVDKMHRNVEEHNYGQKGSSDADLVYEKWIDDAFWASKPEKFQKDQGVHTKKDEYWRQKYSQEVLKELHENLVDKFKE